MFFKLVHEVGNRQRWVTTGTMTTASAERIADDVSGIIGVSGVRVNPRTGSVIVFYDNACGLSPVAEYLKSLAVVPPILRDARKIHVDTAKKAQIESRAALSVPPSAGAPAVSTVVQALRSMPLLRVLSRPLHRLNQVLRDSPASPHKENQAFQWYGCFSWFSAL